MLVAYSYGKVSSICVDPVEKKPLFHYMPGGRCFSVGSVGCNMSCRHCQNYSISQLESGKKRSTFKSPGELAAMCRREGQDVIAFTYNEPMIWFEYIRDVGRADPDLRIILVTNALVEEAPLRELCRIVDAVNIDVKGFTEEFYTDVCGAHLEDVLRSVRTVFSEGVHLELTYLVIPGLNDSPGEVRSFCEWVASELSPAVPVHFTRFHPDYEMTGVPMTPVETVLRCREIGMSCGLEFVYVGNTLAEDADDTFCPRCGALAVRRLGYLVDIECLDGSACGACGRDLGIVRRRASRGRAPGPGRRTAGRGTAPWGRPRRSPRRRPSAILSCPRTAARTGGTGRPCRRPPPRRASGTTDRPRRPGCEGRT